MSFFKFFIKIASHLSIDNICPPNLFECSIIIKMSMIARKVSFKNFWSFGVFFLIVSELPKNISLVKTYYLKKYFIAKQSTC